MRRIERAYLISREAALAAAGSHSDGLSPREAALRLADLGPNELAAASPTPLWRRFLTLLADPMVLVLLAAALISSLLGEWADSLVIAAVILLNTVLSLVQEGRAARAMEALSALNTPQAVVRRGQRLLQVEARELVVGDIVLVEAGDIVPADLRLLDSFQLRSDESSLTGESQPAEKSAADLKTDGSDIPLAERANMLFMGSPVVNGRGEGLVIAVGMDTQIGRIAGLLRGGKQEASPLQKRLAELSRVLSLGVVIISALVFLLTLSRGGEGLLAAFMLAISLAVAAVPEGLVVVVTLVLSHGMRVMSRERALIRRLSAVETLGAVQVICSDKTGTLTGNKMRVRRSCGPRPLLAAVCALCSSVRVDAGGAMLGDPTELALCEFAAANDCPRATRLEQEPLVAELPFDSSRKLMSTLHRQGDGNYRQYTKGGFEQVLERSSYYLDDSGQRRRLDGSARRRLTDQAEAMANDALRVLGAAYRDGLSQPEEAELVFVGLLGLIDPPRPQAKEAVAAAKQAGIRVVMVSGDNIRTAMAIGRELGLLGPGQRAITGAELERMSDTQLAKELEQIRVFARVRPEDKLRIVRAWQRRGQVCAMTGDGVNDAPALRQADIGVGMGRTGAEVSKRLSGLVLADDDFATIIRAVAEGRRIYENIRKAIQFLLSSNLAEVLAIFVASLFGLRLFLPIHLLWINLITDALPAVALGMERAEAGAMLRPPRSSRDSIFAQGMGWAVLRQGGMMAGLTLAAFWLGLSSGPEVATGMAFVTLSSAELFQAWNMRSRRCSIFRLPSGNPLLTLAIITSLGLNLLLLYLPAAGALFCLPALSAQQLLTASLLAFAIVPLVEADKAFRG